MNLFYGVWNQINRGVIMQKRLIRNGDDYALVIGADIIEKLNLTKETIFELSIEGENLVFSPKTENDLNTNISKSLDNVNQKYGAVLKRLGE